MECLQSLKMTAAGFPVPPGFTVTTAAYRQFVADNNLQQTIVDLAKPEIADQRASFDGAAESIQALFNRFEPTDELKAQVAAAYTGLAAGDPATDTPVAVRSSANAEDLPDLSFAGQQDTYLNVRGADAVIAVETSKNPGIVVDYRSLTLPLGESTCEAVVHALSPATPPPPAQATA